VATYNSLVSRTDADALIPLPVSNEIIEGLTRESAALSSFRRARMSSKTVTQPVLSVLPVAYWVTGDTGLKQTSEINWTNQTLTAEELAVIIPVPLAVLDDADFDIWAETRPKLVEAFGAKIDRAALFGVDAPTSWGDGISELAVLAGNSHTEGTGGAVDFADDIAITFGLVEDDGYDVNAVYARRKVRGRLRRLRAATTNEPIFQTFGQGSPDSIYGEDLFYVRNGAWVNNYEMIAGDRNAAILGIRQDITFTIHTEGVISDDSGNVVLNLMQQDSAAMRAVMRVGFAVATPVSAENLDGDFPFAVLINAGS
jgi:HK97 family phage major capsid protein